jgi:Calcineurin-like phosphoesterase
VWVASAAITLRAILPAPAATSMHFGHLRLAATCICTAALAVAVSARATVLVYAAGDVAECSGDPAASPAAATARLIPEGATVLVAGDTTYPSADRATIRACYAPTWGRFRAHTYAAPGNHDYVAGSVKDYLEYFAQHTPQRTWYRAALGDWWLISLDSNLAGKRLDRQQAWLERELATIAGDGRCIVAMWHHALFSNGLHRGDGARMRPAWRMLDAAGADVVLSGHEHYYESFEPLDADGSKHSTGIREFVVGTGGAALTDFALSSDHRAFALEHGVLELELDADRYRWAFHPVTGEVRDRGAAPCRRSAQSTKRTAAVTRAATSVTSAAAAASRTSSANAPRTASGAGTTTPR